MSSRISLDSVMCIQIVNIVSCIGPKQDTYRAKENHKIGITYIKSFQVSLKVMGLITDNRDVKEM